MPPKPFLSAHSSSEERRQTSESPSPSSRDEAGSSAALTTRNGAGGSSTPRGKRKPGSSPSRSSSSGGSPSPPPPPPPPPPSLQQSSRSSSEGVASPEREIDLVTHRLEDSREALARLRRMESFAGAADYGTPARSIEPRSQSTRLSRVRQQEGVVSNLEVQLRKCREKMRVERAKRETNEKQIQLYHEQITRTLKNVRDPQMRKDLFQRMLERLRVIELDRDVLKETRKLLRGAIGEENKLIKGGEEEGARGGRGDEEVGGGKRKAAPSAGRTREDGLASRMEGMCIGGGGGGGKRKLRRSGPGGLF